jgi:BASS family bile acid:Na+ symporter
MMLAAVAVSLATNFSGALSGAFGTGGVLAKDVRSTLTIALLAVMLTVSLSRIPAKGLSPTEDPKGLARGLMLGLVVPSLIPAAGYYVMLAAYPGDYHAWGLVFIAATPFAASVAPLSFILKGDMAHAARCTIYVYVVSLAWIPAVVWLLLGRQVAMTDLVITVAEVIGAPILLSRLLTRVKIDATLMAVALNCIIFVLVWLSAASANFAISPGMVAVLAAVAVARTFGLGLLVNAVEKRRGIPRAQRVPDVLMLSYKNKGIALALCAGVVTGPAIGDAMAAITVSIVVEVLWVAFMDSTVLRPEA